MKKPSLGKKFLTIMAGLFLIYLNAMFFSAIENFLFKPGVNYSPIPVTLGIVIRSVLIMPILEELIFRKWLLNLFYKKWGFWEGSCVSSFLFAILHLDLFFSPYFVNGMIYCYVKEKNGKLIYSIFLHSIYNASVLLLIQIF